MYSLSREQLELILGRTLPSFQAIDADTLNLGFGYLYYALGRIVRPETSVIIGSKKGFSVICLALALNDNEGCGISEISCYRTKLAKQTRPTLHFVDPSYSVHRGDRNHMFGIGFWDDADSVRAWWQEFDVGDIVQHHRMRSDEFAASELCPNTIDCLIIDGDHTYEGMTFDVAAYGARLSPGGIMLLHDVHPAIRPEFGGPRVYAELDRDAYETIRLPIYPGLALVVRRDGADRIPMIDPT